MNKTNNLNTRICIYQVLPRLLCNTKSTNHPYGTIEENGCGKMNDIKSGILRRIKDFGFTHIWYTGLLEHATCTNYTKYDITPDFPEVVKGQAGSPYAVKDYYDIDPDLAVHPRKRMKEFETLVKRTHKADLKMIIDFIPNHVARVYHSDAKPKDVIDLGADDDTSKAFDRNNNFYYLPNEKLQLHNITSSPYQYEEMPAKATGNDAFTVAPSRNDWYETIKLNYGVDYRCGRTRYFEGEMADENVPDTWKKMLDILLFWANKGIDAFRCDMAEMVPVDFWHYAIGHVKKEFPHILFIAEIYNPDSYRNYIHWGKFDYLYDKVGLYDTLRDIICEHRPAAAITHCWQSTDDIQNCMLHFMENHDEQRIASDFFCSDAEKGIPAFAVCAFLNKAPIMLYSGQEMGERGMNEEGFSGKDGRTTIFDYWQAPKSIANHKATPLSKKYAEIIQLTNTLPELREGEMFDLMYVNTGENQSFDTQHQYAFLRSTETITSLIVVNFSDTEESIDVRIPKHAFEHLKLSTGKRELYDITNKKSYTQDLQPDQCVKVKVGKQDFTILRIEKSNKTIDTTI